MSASDKGLTEKARGLIREVWSIPGPGVITGASVLIAAIVVISNDGRVLGKHRNGVLSNVFGIASVLVMGLAAVAMLVTFVTG